MIITVTCNPSIDYIVSVKEFGTRRLNRATDERILPGGKGINVSIVLHNLGLDTVAYGFCAGETGDLLLSLLKKVQVPTDFIHLDSGFTRINVKLRSSGETEINGKGPSVSQGAFDALLSKLQNVTASDIVVLSGSLASGMPEVTYQRILQDLRKINVRVVVDASGNALRDVLPERPFMVKPNKTELGDLFGVTLRSANDTVYYARMIHQMGARNVLVSLGPEGAVLVDEAGETWKANAPEGVVVNTIGAGDSMVAGFLSGLSSTGDAREALRLGLCAGSASAFSEFLATQKEILALLPQVRVESVR
ncbi:MAG: 1-phosphofructokinase [Sphaerochaetaceae bacterium]